MPRVAVTLDDVRAELSRGGILEGSIDVISPRVHVAGYCDAATEIVSIDPHPELAKSVIHEMIHRRHKRLSETRVAEETARIMFRMTPAELKAFCAEYRAKRLKTKRTIIVDHVD